MPGKKKDVNMPKKLTQKRLYNIALYYLSRYESTTEKLRAVLERRIYKVERDGGDVPPETGQWIDSVIEEMVRLGYIDNRRYAENTFRHLSESGKSVRTITNKLKTAGLTDELIEDIFEAQDLSTGEMDLEAARKLVKKRKLGIWRPKEQRQEMYQKDLAVLGRAGFSYETARKALENEDP